MNRSKISPLTESAFAITLSVVMALVAYLQPMFHLLFLIWPVPLVIITARHGLKYGVIGSINTSILLLIFTQPLIILPVIIKALPVALMIGYGLFKRWTAIKTFFSSFVVSLISTALFVIATLYLSGINLYTQLIQLSEKLSSIVTNTIQNSGVVNDSMINLQHQASESIYLFKVLIPCVFIIEALISVIIFYNLSGTLLKRLGTTNINTLPPFSEWRFPILFAYLYGFSLLGRYWGSTRGISWLFDISYNVYFISTLVGIIQGISVIAYFRKIGRISKNFVRVLVVLCIINLGLLLVIGLCGFIDMIFNYRKKFNSSHE